MKRAPPQRACHNCAGVPRETDGAVAFLNEAIRVMNPHNPRAIAVLHANSSRIFRSMEEIDFWQQVGQRVAKETGKQITLALEDVDNPQLRGKLYLFNGIIVSNQPLEEVDLASGGEAPRFAMSSSD